MKNIKPDLLCISIAMALTLAAGSARAETSAEAGAQDEAQSTEGKSVTQLDTIEVTARGVTESLQRVPLPITAISEAEIDRRGLVDMNDVARMTPGFSFKPAFGRIGEVPVIRGMSNISPTASTDANNASLFVDGIYVNGALSEFGLENVAQVEVLRGPQAAAFVCA